MFLAFFEKNRKPKTKPPHMFGDGALLWRVYDRATATVPFSAVLMTVTDRDAKNP